MLLGRDPGEPPELQLSIEQVRGCGDDPLFFIANPYFNF